MRNEKVSTKTCVPGLILVSLVALAALTNGGCSAANTAGQLAQGCDGLDLTVKAQATVKAWVNAVAELDAAASKAEAAWLTVCNEMNADLGLDTSKTTASDACGVLEAHINTDVTNGVTISVTVDPGACEVDLNAQAKCEASCSASASCDVNANCTGGEVVVDCNGSCSGQCDVTAPSFVCMGTCKGECTASAGVSCSGECTGTCDAPTWSGYCDAGCTDVNFVGQCGGTCMGTCMGTTTNGVCSGTCMGACSAKATGMCHATCTGQFSGGQCTGMCTGKCNVSAGATCSGSCNGTCSYMPGSASCTGECHGMCSAQVSPPTCTGTLNCMGSAECHGDCQAQASANVTCAPPQVTTQIMGDDALNATYVAHQADLGTAVNLTLAVKDPIGALAAKTATTFQALGDIGAAGVGCVAAQAQVIAHMQASIQVSVSISAKVTAG
jgi:hypothetical protein